MLFKHTTAKMIVILSALLLISCNQKESIHEQMGYLIANVNSDNTQASEFTGTVVSESKPEGTGVVNLEVKLKSPKGEIIEFNIADYRKNKIYTIQEGGFHKWRKSSMAESSGSYRYGVSARFFFSTENSEPKNSALFPAKHFF